MFIVAGHDFNNTKGKLMIALVNETINIIVDPSILQSIVSFDDDA